MSEEISIRLITPSDKDQFVQLMNEFIQEYVTSEKTYPVHYDSVVGEVYWNNISDKENKYLVVVAEKDLKLIGFCVGEIHKADKVEKIYFNNELQGGIWDFFVKPEYQRRGIGKLLLDKMELVFADHDCLDVVLNGVDMENAGARKLYERLGYKTWSVKYYKRIGN